MGGLLGLCCARLLLLVTVADAAGELAAAAAEEEVGSTQTAHEELFLRWTMPPSRVTV